MVYLQVCVYSYVLCDPSRTCLGTYDRVCLCGRDQLRLAFLEMCVCGVWYEALPCCDSCPHLPRAGALPQWAVRPVGFGSQFIYGI